MINLIQDIKKLLKTNYGRNEGWDVKFKGKTIAYLTNPYWDVDAQFLFEYDLEIIDKSYTEKLLSRDFWNEESLTFFSKAMNEYCKNDLLVRLLRDKDNNILHRVSVRYLNINPPWWLSPFV